MVSRRSSFGLPSLGAIESCPDSTPLLGQPSPQSLQATFDIDTACSGSPRDPVNRTDLPARLAVGMRFVVPVRSDHPAPEPATWGLVTNVLTTSIRGVGSSSMSKRCAVTHGPGPARSDGPLVRALVRLTPSGLVIASDTHQPRDLQEDSRVGSGRLEEVGFVRRASTACANDEVPVRPPPDSLSLAGFAGEGRTSPRAGASRTEEVLEPNSVPP